MEQEFGPALRARRRAAGFSPRALAARTNLDFSYISKVENGRLPPPAADTMTRHRATLDMAPEDLLALTRKLPSSVHQTVSRSTAAQVFLREAQRRLRRRRDQYGGTTLKDPNAAHTWPREPGRPPRGHTKWTKWTAWLQPSFASRR